MSIRPLSTLNAAFSIRIHTKSILPLFFKSSKLYSQFGFTRNKLFLRPGPSGLVSNSTCRNPLLKLDMAASAPRAAATADLIADNMISSYGNVPSLTKCSAVHFVAGSRKGSQTVGIRMRFKEPSSRRSSAVHGYFIFDVTRMPCSSNPVSELWSKNYSSSSSTSYSDSSSTGPDVSLNSSSCDEQFASLSIAADEKRLGDRSLKLQSGSCYMPHPDKEKTGGEDAHFICMEEQVIGVADGVGGWADVGVDAGEYARGLMSNSVKAIHDEPKGCIDPARVLTKAHSNTKVLGSSTACIIAITDQQGIHAINLGDSGFIVIRDGCTIFQSGVQQHGFNFPYQLENGPNGDLPSSGQVFSVAVVPGDVIVAGTDGLFDNLFNNDITAIVVQAVKAGLNPETTAQNIAALARQRALDRTRQSPFSKAAQEAGLRYFGGKLDDVTVVVAYLSDP